MLPEHQGVVKVESEVPPVQFGAQGCVSSVQSETKVNGGVRLPSCPGKMKDFRLVMLQDESQGSEESVDDAISRFELWQVLHKVRGLGEDGAIIHIRQQLYLPRDGLEGEQLHNGSDVQIRQDR